MINLEKEFILTDFFTEEPAPVAPKDAVDISDAGSVLTPSHNRPARSKRPMGAGRPNRNPNRGGNRPPYRGTSNAPAQPTGNGASSTSASSRPGVSEPRRSGGNRPPRRDGRPSNRPRPQGMQNRRPEATNVTRVISRAPNDTLRIVPLGGSGEIGDKNMLVYEFNNDLIIIDAGIKFPDANMPGIDYVICDTTYLEQNKDRIRAYVVTHGHEDHIGAFPYIWPKFPVPIYTAPLTAGLIRAKFEEHGLQGYEFRIIAPGEKIQIGAFQIEPVRMTHSIPDILGLAITTPAGLIYHATDWKIDFTPTHGLATDFTKLSELAERGVTCLLSDSTNVFEPGYTISEQVVGKTIQGIFGSAKGRIIISSFSSRIDRIQHVITACAETGRVLALSGRSMERNVNITMELGYLKVPKGVLVDIRAISKYPDHKVVIMSTGSQGEENSALVRMASGEHRHIRIKKGDTVVLSASAVPGNENAISKTINNLYREGAEVITNRTIDIHSSGHANREEMKLLISLLQPKYLIPIHGDYRHLFEHAKLATELGMPADNCFIIENGQVVEFTDGNGRITGEKVPVGDVLIDGLGVGDVGEIVLRDRQTMAEDGVFMVILTVDGKKGELKSSPDIISRGFVYMKESEDLIGATRSLIKRLHATQISRGGPANWDGFKKTLRDEVGNLLYDKTQRRPMVIPVVIQV